MSIEFDIASDQIDGARDYQEDAFMVSLMGDNDAGKTCALVVMADGMGGHAAGNVASNMVVATFNKAFQGDFDGKDAPVSLSSALNRANQQIHDSISETPALRGMGCTMVSTFMAGNELYWVSVGDSHLYLIRERELVKQNADHSYGAYIDMMKEQGMDIEEQAGMSRNMLMSAMTGEEISSIDCPETSFKLKPGDRLIIASDGLDTLGAGAIIQYSSWSTTARECVYALLKAVEEANKINQDNTTIIVVDVKEKAKQPSDAPPPPKESLSKRAKIDPEPVKHKLPQGKKSTAGLFKAILLLLFVGAGFYTWQQGMLDGVISDVTSLAQQQLAANKPEVKPQSAQVEEPPVVTKPKQAVKKPEKTTPAPVVVEETYKDKHDPFTDRLKVGGRGPIMVKVSGNDFRMGSAGLVSADETPRHAVTVPTFAMSIYEVTFAEYDIFAKATRRKQPDSKGRDRKAYPVSDISWEDALAYSKWLSKQTGKKYRLPSEAEWEFAARGGKRTTYWWGSTKGSGNAHCFDCSSDLNTTKTAKVGSYKPNQFGLYDTAGNLYEWVYDCYHRNYKGAPDDGSVWDGGDCSVRIVRGGSFRSPASSMRVENRETFSSKKGQYNVGIRLVRDI
ncbi:MAG: SUMF1/EgtB/PvdO family nonheme iron enzyme [Gammaproteobacteria bacterium]|nr:SUMF1/EgtB/PvdO family nonheme iron enzyme [Gammaproteobacteria bacterium]